MRNSAATTEASDGRDHPGALKTNGFSVVVPVLDEAAVLPELLHALAPLRKQGVEVVVVDGGSGDGSADIARDGADRLLTAPRGRARQMNAGARAARGDVLLFLHADTRLPAGALRAVAAALAGGARWGFFGLAIGGRRPLLRVVAALATLRARATGIATGDQALFVTRALFDQAGGFPDIALMEDVAFSRRLRAIARPARLRLRALTSGRRWERGGVLRTVFLMWRLRLLYRLGAAPERLARRYRDVRGR